VVNELALHVVSQDSSCALVNVGYSSRPEETPLSCDLAEEIVGIDELTNAVKFHQLFGVDSVHQSYDWANWVDEVLDFDGGSQDKGVGLICGGEDDSWRVNEDDILVKLDLLADLGHTWCVTSRSGFSSLERVNYGGLSDVWEADDANCDELLRLLVLTIDPRVVLEDVHETLNTDCSRCAGELVSKLWVLSHGLLVQGSTGSNV